MGSLLWVAQVLQHQDELVASEAAQGVFLAHALAQALRHLPQQAVASGMTQAGLGKRMRAPLPKISTSMPSAAIFAKSSGPSDS